MEDISGVGLRVTIVASNTFPSGITITQFADDADPFDVPSMQLADKAMGLNGDLITWSKASPLTPTINVIPGSEDDKICRCWQKQIGWRRASGRRWM